MINNFLLEICTDCFSFFTTLYSSEFSPLRSLTLTSSREILSNFLFLHLEAARRFLNLFLYNLIFSWDSILIGVIFLERPPPRPLGAGVFTDSSSEKLSSSSKSSLESSISSLILNSAESMEPEALDSGLGLNSGTEDKARCSLELGTTNFDAAALWAAVAFSMVSIEVLVFGSFLITDGSPTCDPVIVCSGIWCCCKFFKATSNPFT